MMMIIEIMYRVIVKLIKISVRLLEKIHNLNFISFEIYKKCLDNSISLMIS